VLTSGEVAAVIGGCSPKAPTGTRRPTRGFHPSATDGLARWLDVRRQLAGRGPRSGQYVRNLLHRLGGRAGIDERVYLHGLRHTFVWELEGEGDPVHRAGSLCQAAPGHEYFGRRATSQHTQKTFAEQHEQLDKTLAT